MIFTFLAVPLRRMWPLSISSSQIFLFSGDVQRVADGLKMQDFLLRLPDQGAEGFIGALELVVFFEIPLRVFHRGELGIQRDGDFLPRVIIERLQGFRPRGRAIAVGVQKFPVNPVTNPFLRVLQLFLQQVVFPDVSFQRGGDDAPQIRGALPDAGDLALLRVIFLQKGGNALEMFQGTGGPGGQGNGGIFRRNAAFGSDARGKAPRPDVLHHGRKCRPERLPVLRPAGGGGQLRSSARPMADFVGNGGRKPGESRIERLITVHGAGKNPVQKRFPGNGERIQLVLGVWNEPGLAGQHLTDGADQTGNMLDAVDDPVVFIAENDVAVLSHDLHDELFAAKIPQLIHMLHGKADDPFQPGLGNLHDPAVLQMLAQEHAEIRSRSGTGLVFPGQIDERQRSAGADTEAQGAGALFDGEQKLVRLRLRDLGKPAFQKVRPEIRYQIGDGNTVESHCNLHYDDLKNQYSRILDGKKALLYNKMDYQQQKDRGRTDD